MKLARPASCNIAARAARAAWGLALAVLLLCAASARAETVYVGDDLKLAVHGKPSLNSAVVRLLPIGTPLELVEQRGPVAHVKIGNGFEGWVESAFLSDVPPTAELTDEAGADFSSGEDAADLARALEELKEMEQRAIIAETKLLALAAAPEPTEVPDTAQDADEAPDAETPAPPGSTRPSLQAPPDPAPPPMDSESLREIERLALENQALRAALDKHESVASSQSRDVVGEALVASAPLTAADAATAAGIAVAAQTSGENPQPGGVGQWLRSTVLASLLEPLAPGPAEWLPEWNHWQWLFSISAIAFAFAFGAWLVSFNLRRRHGGFSV